MTTRREMPVQKLRIRIFVFILLLIMIYFGFSYLIPPDIEDIEVPNGLHPIVEEKQDELMERANQKGIPILISDGFRSIEEQNNLYEQGRSKPGKIVTNARGGESLHNFGLAIDFALLNKDGIAIWDMEYDGNQNNKQDWLEVVDLAKELGFEWGGDWTAFKDYPHLQMDFGISLRELQRGTWRLP